MHRDYTKHEYLGDLPRRNFWWKISERHTRLATKNLTNSKALFFISNSWFKL